MAELIIYFVYTPEKGFAFSRKPSSAKWEEDGKSYTPKDLVPIDAMTLASVLKKNDKPIHGAMYRSEARKMYSRHGGSGGESLE